MPVNTAGEGRGGDLRDAGKTLPAVLCALLGREIPCAQLTEQGAALVRAGQCTRDGDGEENEGRQGTVQQGGDEDFCLPLAPLHAYLLVMSPDAHSAPPP